MNYPFASNYIALCLWLAAGLSYSSSALANLDNWLLDIEGENSIAFRYGAGQHGLTIAGLSGELNLAFRYQFFFDYFTTSEEQPRFDFNYYSAGINSDPIATWSITFKHEYFGNSNAYEQQDYKLSLQYFPSHYLVAIGLSKGDVKAYADSQLIDLIEQQQGQNPLLDRIGNTGLSTDSNGYFAEAKLFLGNWQWGIHDDKINYSEDIALLNARPRIQQLIDQQALSQIYGLIDWRLSADSLYTWEKTSLQLAVTRIQSTVDSEKRDYFFTTTEYFPRNYFSVSFTLANSLQEHLPYAEVATRFYG